MAFAVKRFDDILTDMINWMVANQTKVTDFNEGSIVRTFCEAVGLEVEQLYIRARVGFGIELKEIPFYAFNFSRESAQQASGNVKFTRSGTSGTTDIPINTLVSTTDGTQFETTAAGQITPGNSESADIPILAVEGGTDGNVPAATITVLVTPITDVISVTNDASTTGGQNEESEEEYLQRFREFIEGLGDSNISGLVSGAKSVSGVRSASVIEHFPPSSSYNATVYIDDGAGNASQALIDAVELVLIGDGTSVNPGKKAGGINIQVLAPTKVTINVTVEITGDGTVSEESMEYLTTQAIENYVNNLTIGDDVIYNELVKSIMGVEGVLDIDITVPSSNTTINDNQIARTGTVTITFA